MTTDTPDTELDPTDVITNEATGTEYTEWMVGGTTNIAHGIDVGYFYQATEAEFNGRSSDVSLVGVTLALQF